MRFETIYKYRVSSRGRPRELNIEKTLSDLYEATSKAVPVLSDIRRSTKGYRSDAVLGTSTTAPAWVEQAEDLLRGAQYGRDLSVQEIKSIQSTIKDLSQLGSRYQAVRERASLSERIQNEYFEALDEFSSYAKSGTTRSNVEDIKQAIRDLSPQQKAEFFQSQYYQRPEKYKKYKRVLDWAQADSGNNEMTMQEAWSYTFLDRIKKGIDVNFQS